MRRLVRTFAAASVAALVLPLLGLVSTSASADQTTYKRQASQRQIALATPATSPATASTSASRPPSRR